MAFFFFLLVAAGIGFAVWNAQRRNNESTFTNAATRLGLRVTSDHGAIRRPWIYGEIDDVRVDVKPFTRQKNGTRSTWTGYRLTFREPVRVAIKGDDDPKRRIMARLTNRFAECALNENELFCARSSLAEDSTRIVNDVEYILGAARELRAAPETEPHPPEKEPAKTPPPIPEPKDIPELATPIRREVEPPQEEPTPAFHEVDLKAALSQELTPEKAPAAEIPETTGVEESDLEQDEPPQRLESELPLEEEPTPTPAPPPADQPPPGSLGAAAQHLFDSGLNRFEAGRTFDSEYQGKTPEGTGILRRVDRYANDRFFGRGPGLIAEVELLPLENASGGLTHSTAVVQLPSEEESGLKISYWRERLGEDVQVCGTLIRCDAFTGKIYLADGLIDSPGSLATA